MRALHSQGVRSFSAGPSHIGKERRAFDYSDLEAWMAHADQVIRSTRHALDRLARSEPSGASASPVDATNLDPGKARDETPPPTPAARDM